ncbi:hypothetical protein [Planctomicrobium piriforme]|uniref:Uncharacterized protein n=1 Tax=Planctomicrobium piriforme TaxID=1576369 RepID=A0A1I3G0A2_9PLAN|nr:hypothetical protein [Planctomicrobium piriforme]SFI16889.1 hypothetical protein SAMN05421753_106115 [Planctomicrobium piriforme]
MVTSLRRWSLPCLIAGIMLPVLPAVADDVEGVIRLGHHPSAGVVHVNDSHVVVRGQSPDQSSATPAPIAQANCEQQNCPQQYSQQCPQQCPQSSEVVTCKKAPLPWQIVSWIHNDFARKGAWFRGKCGHGDGSGHHQDYPLAGKYHIVYPQDPSYFDARDGQVYAAQGYGGPVSVPLAPVVNHTYNYGWGVPSSRLTPVLHPVTQAPPAVVPGVYPSAPIAY